MRRFRYMTVDINNIINRIKAEYYKLSALDKLKEENIKQFIIMNIFLPGMGYDIDSENVTFEANVKKEFTDITVLTNNDTLVVETKTGMRKLDYDDIQQIMKYLSTKGTEWGILTNGKEFILLNSKIEVMPNDNDEALRQNVVLEFDVTKSGYASDPDLFRCMTEEWLFKSKRACFFRDIAQYKAFFKKGSWIVYKSTLYNFFKYYSMNSNKPYTDGVLETITQFDFYSYMGDTKPEATSKTLKNNLAHIKDMFKTLYDNKKIRNNLFNADYDAERKETEPKKLQREITDIELKTMIEYLGKGMNVYRNIAILLLCSCYGFGKKDVNNLLWDDLKKDGRKYVLTHSDRVLILPQLISDCFYKLDEERKKNRIKINNVFLAKGNDGKWKALGTTTVNDIFDKFKSIGEEKFWEDMSPQFVKICAYHMYYNKGYSIDKIAYYCNTTLDSLDTYISKEMMYSRIKSNTFNKETPIYKDILNKHVEDFINK